MMDSFLFGCVVGGFTMTLLAVFMMDGSPDDAMREAFERGHAVQCLGKTGYHWECEK